MSTWRDILRGLGAVFLLRDPRNASPAALWTITTTRTFSASEAYESNFHYRVQVNLIACLAIGAADQQIAFCARDYCVFVGFVLCRWCTYSHA